MSHEARYKTEFNSVDALHAALEKLLGEKVQKVSEDSLHYKKGIYNYTYADRKEDGNFEIKYDTDMRRIYGTNYSDTSMCKLKQLYGLYKYQSIYEEMGFTCTVEEQKTAEGLCYILTGEEQSDEVEEAIGEAVLI